MENKPTQYKNRNQKKTFSSEFHFKECGKRN